MCLFRKNGSLFRVTAMTEIRRIFRTAGRVGLLPCRASALLISLVCLAGCADKTTAVFSRTRMEAIRHNQRGITAESRGRHAQALEDFAESLRINRSIENSEGVVVSLINSSRVLRQNGNNEAARVMLNGAVQFVTPESPLNSEFSFEMAQVLLTAGALDQAVPWVSQAGAAETGAQHGRRINLLARLRYLQGNLTEADKLVREALLINRENGAREEEANSHRTLADIMAAGSRHAEAANSYTTALDIDKDLGTSRKIAADLRGLAHLYRAQSDLDHALVYYRRAVDVSSAGGDRSGAADDLVNMSRIHDQRGEKEQAENLLFERDSLLKNMSAPNVTSPLLP
jgi:tetratricopeptide (TPR) repeat protein